MSSIKLGIKAAIDTMFPPAMVGVGAGAVGLNAAGTALVDRNGNAIALADAPIGAAQRVIQVDNATYVISPADDGAVFVCTGVCTFYYPEMNTLPTCDFFAPAVGSIILIPQGTTAIAGSNAQRAISRLMAPGGFSIYADRSSGAAPFSFVLAAGSSWNSLAGSWRDATELATAVDAKLDRSQMGELKGMNGTQKMDNNYTANNAQKGILYYVGAVDKTLNIPNGLDLDYCCRIGKFNSNANVLILAPGNGVGFTVKGADQTPRRLSIQGDSGWIRCNGLNSFYVEGCTLTV